MMAYTSGFFDAVDQGGGDYDRVYNASTFAHYFSLLVKDGVFPDPSTGMQVKASSNPDMHVSVQPGSGWVNGYYITVGDNAPEQLTIPTANPSLSRIDSVIMGLNYVDREIQLYIKSGAVSASPSAVSLQRDNDLYELELAQIAVGAGVASISQANITDMRQNTSRCGIVAGTIDQIDTTDLFAQYDDAFQTWFDNLKAQLGDNIVANLQNQIDLLETNKVSKDYLNSKDFLQKSGGTMSGNLLLSGNPTTDLMAATKQYVDSHQSVNYASSAGNANTVGGQTPAQIIAGLASEKGVVNSIAKNTDYSKWPRTSIKYSYTMANIDTNVAENDWLITPGQYAEINFDTSVFPGPVGYVYKLMNGSNKSNRMPLYTLKFKVNGVYYTVLENEQFSSSGYRDILLNESESNGKYIARYTNTCIYPGDQFSIRLECTGLYAGSTSSWKYMYPVVGAYDSYFWSLLL